MWESIDIDKLDKLLGEFNKLKGYKEKFSQFLQRKEKEGGDIIDITDSVGIVTPEDFENKFDEDFIKQNFEDLAHDWFNGLEGQADFGILLDVVAENFEEQYKEWKEDSVKRMIIKKVSNSK